MAHSEHIQCLNALLEEMDGVEDNSGIAVIAATNRIEVMDEGLLRPGRFDRKVHVPLPGRDDRLEILTVHARRLPRLTADLARWADQTRGFSGADLANLVNEAAVEAARVGRQEVIDSDFTLARDRVLMGARDHGRTPSDRDREFVAYHESGHALM
uniref:AAA+ ATPase domain-containing protein n=1 Tax=Meleagris gallopavo TaxID=9103 RepID=A0A803YI19_MELGA